MFLNVEVESTELVETRVEEIVRRLFRLFETDESQRCRDGYGRKRWIQSSLSRVDNIWN